jgi:hypothetical protein
MTWASSPTWPTGGGAEPRPGDGGGAGRAVLAASRPWLYPRAGRRRAASPRQAPPSRRWRATRSCRLRNACPRPIRPQGEGLAVGDAVPRCAMSTFAVRRGETLAIVGESGSGKSTVARLRCAPRTPDPGAEIGSAAATGSASTCHHDRAAAQGVPRKVQMVFQDPYPRSARACGARHPDRTAAIHGLGTGAERRDRAAELLRLGRALPSIWALSACLLGRAAPAHLPSPGRWR